MKRRIAPLLLIAAAISMPSLAQTTAPSIDSMPPVVVKTFPESGARNVAAGEMEIKVTFSKAMTDNSWSWSTQN